MKINNKLIVVLGMHRSGTSAITKSLEVLGVGLGANLHPAGLDNPKGFWEDIECMNINDSLLNYYDSTYDSLNLAWEGLRKDPKISELKLRATQHINRKLKESNGLWGFKDPRTCRLLGFWNEVFTALTCEINFLVVVRNPASVVSSLDVRNKIPAEKAYFLWLQHTLPSMTFMRDTPRVVVDYDEFLVNPYAQLLRISSKFKLTIPDEQSALVTNFKTKFLEINLRHTNFTESELALDSRASATVVATYGLLHRLAKDQQSLESTDIQNELNALNTSLKNFSPAFDYINDIEHERASLWKTVGTRDGQLEAYRLQSEKFDDLLRSTIKEHDKVNQQVVSQNGQIAELNQTIVEQDQELEAYRLQLEQFDSLLCTANTQIESLNQTIATRDNDIAFLSTKKSWSVIKPIRDLFSVKNANRPAVESLGKQAITLDQLPEDFDGDLYLELNEDLVAARVDPSKHYLKYGQHEGREYKPTELNATDIKNQLPEDFDGNLYLKLNPDLAEIEVDPFIHYLRHGYSEGRIYKLIEVDDQLPEDFDGDTYLKLNADLVAVGIDPAKHYSRFGRREERIYKLPELDVSGEHEINPALETILVVSHEASRTGAPILSLNLVQSFVGPYNVVALLLGGGPLSEEFLSAGAVVANAYNLRGNPGMASHVVEQLCERFKFKFALVNSIESRFVLPQLSEYFIPTVSLIHEFASYSRPRNAFRETLFWSGEVVFSANVTKENAFNQFPDLSHQAVHTLPQGRCLLPFSEANEEASQAESLHIQRLMRPKGLADDVVIVLGAGSVQLRKGVDLFIECATRVFHLPGGEKCRFVWVGNGYDPENDLGYSVYLADQIRRAGIQEHFVFIDETTAIETAYQEADMLLLSSRLDPLPNVAIDAMVLGVPVLCFDKTTGIADFLIEIGLGSQCVADYIDSTNMAEKILALAASSDLRKAVGGQCQQASIAFFDMTRYVASLESLAKMASESIKQEQADTQTILDSGLFRTDFSTFPQDKNQAIEKQIRFYVREWVSGIGRRKPFPGFHPGIYIEQHGVTNKGSDPFGDYLRAGQPEGPWIYPVIEANELEVDNLPDNHRVALHIHVYYPELLPEIMMRLSSNQICPDLFVSITDEKNRQLVVEALKEYKGNVVDIQLVPNRGRDIGPFLTAFGHKILANYDFVGHIHTKKSVDIKDASVGETWRQFLLEHLLGGESGAMADNILSRLHNDASVGLVFPDDPYIVGWEANLSIAKPLAQKLGFDNLPEHFVFPVGTMFWAKTAALAPLINLNLDWEDYPEEPLPYDGSLLHAIERLFYLCPLLSNMHSATTHVIGLTR
jgi:glycosyltransferase involved in cell wall biosynthesis